MHAYSAGTTPNYGFDIPMALFTTTAIPAGATLEEAAALVRANGKTTVWYQTQIHPNEPASGEAALVIIDDFIDWAQIYDECPLIVKELKERSGEEMLEAIPVVEKAVKVRKDMENWFATFKMPDVKVTKPAAKPANKTTDDLLESFLKNMGW